MEEKRGSNIVEDEDIEETENIIINEVDGLPNLHPNYQQLGLEFDIQKDHNDLSTRSVEDLVHDEDLPTSVIVTNVDPRVFKSDELKVTERYNENQHNNNGLFFLIFILFS